MSEPAYKDDQPRRRRLPGEASRLMLCHRFQMAPAHFDLLVDAGELPPAIDGLSGPRWDDLSVRASLMAIHHEVYFASMGEFIKIGISQHLSYRLKGFETSLPMPVTLLHAMKGGSRTEDVLHTKFAAHRARGEWFYDVPEIRAYIETIKGQK